VGFIRVQNGGIILGCHRPVSEHIFYISNEIEGEDWGRLVTNQSSIHAVCKNICLLPTWQKS
jgi:hypothetical protein